MKQIIMKLTFATMAYFAPIAAIIQLIWIFLGIDFVSGIWVSYKRKLQVLPHKSKVVILPIGYIWKNVIESSKAKRTIYKMIWYTVAVMISYMMEKTFSMEWSQLASITGGFICFIELKSIFENITQITDEPIFMRIYKLFEKKAKETYKTDDDE